MEEVPNALGRCRDYLETDGYCKLGPLLYHKAIRERFPQVVDEMICLEEERFGTINIGGLADYGVTHHPHDLICHTIHGQGRTMLPNTKIDRGPTYLFCVILRQNPELIYSERLANRVLWFAFSMDVS